MVQAFLHTKPRPHKPLGKRKRARRRRYATTWGINSAGRGPVQSDLAPMKTKTHFAFRVDIWDDTGNSIVEHVAGVDDFEVAEATYRAAVARWRVGSFSTDPKSENGTRALPGKTKL
jgi:hypothetical protein